MRGLIFGVVLTAWFCMTGQSSAQMDESSSTITISNGLTQIAEQLCKDDGGLFYFPDGLGWQVYGIGYWQPMWIDFAEYPSLQKLKSDATLNSNQCVLGQSLYGVQPLHITVTLDLLSGDLVLSPGCSSEELASIAAPEGYQVGQWPVDCRVVERLWEQWQTVQKDPDWKDWYGSDAKPFLTFHFQLADLNEKQVYEDNVVAEEMAWEEAQATIGKAQTGMLTAMAEEEGGGGQFDLESACTITNESEPFYVLSIMQGTSGCAVTWSSCSDHMYGVLSADFLTPSTVYTGRAAMWGLDGSTSWTDTTTTNVAHRFYKIVRMPAGGDFDGDGIPNAWELQYGINPLDPSDAAASATTDGLTYWDLWLMGDDFQGSNSLARLYVDVNATNAGNGTATSPFQQLQQGIDAVPTNDARVFIIHVTPGVYNENVQITNKRNVMIVGSNAFTTVLSGNSGDQPVITASAFNFLRIKGLSIRDGISKTNGAGVMANAPNGRLFVTHCVISGNFAWQNGGGIWCNVASNSMLLNNIIAGNEADNGGGVYVAGGQLSLLQNTVVTNVADLGNGGAVSAVSTSSVSAANCILWHNGSNATANVSVQYWLVDAAGGTTGTGNFTNAPKFVSEFLQDYHLHSGSPARAAAPSNFVYDDIDGEARPTPGQARDVGADQYVDANGNGIADYWEKLYSFGGLFDLSDPNADADDDGSTNLQEFNAGTDPTEPGASGGSSQSQEFSLLSSSTPCFVCTNLPPAQTGVALGTVTAGSNYSYQASGCIKFQSTEPGGSADPDGNVSQDHCATFTGSSTAGSGFLCPGLKRYSLVGKIDGGSCFQMGSSGSFTASASGTLTVFFNDDVWGDNSGSWTVCIGANAEAQKLIDTNQTCNFIPDPYGKGLPANKLYVAQRASGKAELQIQTSLSPSIGGVGKKFVWGVLNDSGSLLTESGTLQDNGTATVAFTPTGDHKVYTVRVGCDQNNNGKLDLDEIIDTPTTAFKALVITQNDYNMQRSWLNTWAVNVASIGYSVSPNLMKAFLNATAPAGATASTGSLSAGDARLTHIAGAAFASPSCTATVTNYNFGTSTDTGLKVAKSQCLETNRVAFLKSKKAEVTAFFATNSVASHTFTWNWDTTINYDAAGFLSNADDLHYAFGGVHLQVTVAALIASNLTVDTVQTLGSITDLYDFRYEDGGKAQRAATVEIGWHASPSNVGGGIFTDSVQINSLRNTCKHL
jgi:hypothetical protein